MLNYTEGNWELRKGRTIHWIEHKAEYGTEVIARIESWMPDWEANANLIKAAPKMYEALKDIIQQYELARMPVPTDLADSIRVFGKVAIAEAEGRR